MRAMSARKTGSGPLHGVALPPQAESADPLPGGVAPLLRGRGGFPLPEFRRDFASATGGTAAPRSECPLGSNFEVSSPLRAESADPLPGGVAPLLRGRGGFPTIGTFLLLLCLNVTPTHAQPRFSGMALDPLTFSLSDAFTNGAVTIEQADAPGTVWEPLQNCFTPTQEVAVVASPEATGMIFRASAWDFSDTQYGFTNFVNAYGRITLIAGPGATRSDDNEWRPEFEGGPATNALLSTPHMAMANREGEIFIADKDAHAIRKIRHDGTITTVAGINAPGNGADTATNAAEVALYVPNGLWVGTNGTLYILDMGNGKIRRVATDGSMTLLFSVPSGIFGGRGLWVSDDEQLAYVSSSSVVKKWTPAGGVVNYATGFTQLGNLVVDSQGYVVVTDRGADSVYRLSADGATKTRIAGTGGSVGGGDGHPATSTGLDGVRGIWFFPTGAYLLCTHEGSQVWYVDTDGIIHLFLNGDRDDAHAGDGTWFYKPSEWRVSENRAITVDWQGNILLVENDRGFVRKIEFLPCEH